MKPANKPEPQLITISCHVGQGLPNADPCNQTLTSMQTILQKTQAAHDAELNSMSHELGVLEKESNSEKLMHLRRTKAAEVRVVRNAHDLREPGEIKFRAEPVNLGTD